MADEAARAFTPDDDKSEIAQRALAEPKLLGERG